jgi:hypothetical protein
MDMVLISTEEAKAKLLDCKVLLKYMVFLQNNGFSDCGKGQIMGQAALLEEYLKEEEKKQYKGTFDKPHKQIEEQEKQIITSTEEPGKISETFRENTTNIYKGFLRQVGNMIEKPKDIKDVNSNYVVKKDDPSIQKFQVTQSHPVDNNTINEKQIGVIEENKEMIQSWRDKIKRMTQVDIR